jgi:branched-chain amino acid transport system permease protein
MAESFSAFWASALKDAIVFGLVLPVLVWRSLFSPHPEEE